MISDEMFKRERVPDADELTRLMAERGDIKAQEVGRCLQVLGVEDIVCTYFTRG